ncbi:hypothetical protein [Microbacterium binotii]|uniref:Uncharacterized protein n=1 Tax=Microbacterium binotii TaxID=462710 RepID=A0ABN3PBQ7_9MICO
MVRRTAEQELDHQMQKLKDMGVTVSVSLAPGVPGGKDRPAGVLAEAARRNGIAG